MVKWQRVTLYLLLLLLLFFYDPLYVIAPWISNIDEIIGVVSFVLIMFVVLKNFLFSKLINYTLVILLIIGIIGIISSLIGGINVDWLNRFIDLFGLYKVQFAFLAFLFIPKSNEKEITLKCFSLIIKIFVNITLIFGIINLFRDVGMSHDIRFGIRSFQFIYTNPGTLNDRLISGLGILYSAAGIRKNKLYVVESCLVMLLTLRANALGAIVVLITLSLFFGKKFKISLKNLIPVALFGVIAGWTSINRYLIQDDTPRAIMLRNSFSLAKSYFPFGAGLGTYGSDIAFKFYSPLYYNFGYDKIWVLAPVVGTVANDNFWPMMLGQFGVSGTILFFGILILQLNFILKNFKDIRLRSIAIVIFAYIFMKSMGEAVYTAEFSLLPYMIIGFLFRPYNPVNENKKK